MRKILLGFLIVASAAFTAAPACAQDAATQQQIDKLSGQIQDLLDAQAAQGKRIDAVEKKISDLGDKLSQPAANNYASTDDLKKLAEQLQELAKKQQDDNDLILKEFEKLAKGGSISPVHAPSPDIADTTNNPDSGVPQKGYEYPIQKDDTVDAIARAYRAKGVKVTRDQILKANPGLNPNKMVVGKTIFIPDPSAK